ncbi:MAG: glycosyltransferase [Mycobacterium sp.]|nr:MAG: glycosyltransferase [Mycobacterium sp.]
MEFVLACSGTRGDCEPSVAVGRELQRRGHRVRIAIPPNLVEFAESVGLDAVAYGPNADQLWTADFFRNFSKNFFRKFWTIREPVKIIQELWQPVMLYWSDMDAVLTPMAYGADLLCHGLFFQGVAVNVAEYYDIPFATLDYFPVRPNRRTAPPLIPARLFQWGLAAYEGFGCWMNRRPEDAQRRRLGLPKTRKFTSQRLAELGALQIQTYDELIFPGLKEDWADLYETRPFVGTLSMGLETNADDEVLSWIAAGTPPICFGFGSMPLESAADTVTMIAKVCAELGERALVCSGWTDYSQGPQFDHVRVVGPVSYEKIFPRCRAVVHHGGSGTTAAALRAGVPSLILWMAGDQPFWGAQLKRLRVGTARKLISTTQDQLLSDLRQICTPEYETRARELGARMIPRAESVRLAADHLERFARKRASTRPGTGRAVGQPDTSGHPGSGGQPDNIRSLAERRAADGDVRHRPA